MPDRRLRGALAALALAALTFGCARAAASNGPYGLGRPATTSEIAPLDIDVAPDGSGLPDGRGDAATGARVFATSCARCHGAGVVLSPERWAYATTLFDYVRRAMPPDRVSRLSANDLYAVVAFELTINGVLARDVQLDRKTLPQITLPGRGRFFTGP
ncbi:MAG TPA: c-type cytochrome [Candidatus Elarobacter sp.]